MPYLSEIADWGRKALDPEAGLFPHSGFEREVLGVGDHIVKDLSF